MAWDSMLAKMAIFATKGVFRVIEGRVPGSRYRALVTATAAHVLAQYPGLSLTKATGVAQKATSNPPAADMMPETARPSTSTAKAGTTKKRPGTASRKTSGRKTTKKKTVRKAPRRKAA